MQLRRGRAAGLVQPDVLAGFRPIAGADVDTATVRGQYAGYREEPGVSAQSRTETFVALQVFIDNSRWAGVPFFLRTGRRLPKRASEIAVHLKDEGRFRFVIGVIGGEKIGEQLSIFVNGIDWFAEKSRLAT